MSREHNPEAKFPQKLRQLELRLYLRITKSCLKNWRCYADKPSLQNLSRPNHGDTGFKTMFVSIVI